jgi:hypothetical protein
MPEPDEHLQEGPPLPDHEARRRELWELYKLVLDEQQKQDQSHQHRVTIFTGLLTASLGGVGYAWANCQPDQQGFVLMIGGMVVAAIAVNALVAHVHIHGRVHKTMSTRRKIQSDLHLDDPAFRLRGQTWREEPMLYPDDIGLHAPPRPSLLGSVKNLFAIVFWRTPAKRNGAESKGQKEATTTDYCRTLQGYSRRSWIAWLFRIFIALGLVILGTGVLKCSGFTFGQVTPDVILEDLSRARSVRFYGIQDATAPRLAGKRSALIDAAGLRALVARATHKDSYVIWKGSYAVNVILDDGSTRHMRVSCYGSFFAVEGCPGYFVLRGQNAKEWREMIAAAAEGTRKIKPAQAKKEVRSK